ncbi:MAG: CHAT domain-containing protein, partial [bacterium]|nr:CHAT domain-containing protein [bacterium]
MRVSPGGIPEYSVLLNAEQEMDLLTWKGLVANQMENHPFIFFNACKLGQSHRIANMVDGWAPAVLEKGAGGYIGALWPLADKGAADFATRFYRKIYKKLEDEPVNVAEVLRKTRRWFLHTGDPTYLAYIF